MKRIRVVSVALILVAAAVAAPRADILEQILVKVNGEIITKTDLEQRQIAAIRQMQPNTRPSNDAELQKALSEVTPQVIVNAVDELLFVQRGKELGYALSTERFNSIVDNIKKDNKIESDEAFQAALRQENMTMADLRRQLERQMLIQQVQQVEVMNKIGVTEEEITRYYNEHKNEFTTPSQITLREILISVPTTAQGVNVGADDDAKAKAEKIRERIAAGEPFARLAADESDSPSKANGGLIGPISASDLSPELQKEIEGLKVGEMTQVLRGSRGYQILRVESMTPTEVKSLDDARAEIADKVAGTKRQAEFGKYLEKLRAQAIIEWKNDEIKQAYEIGLKSQQDAPTP
ncbi:MAG: peptidyl-prolyl cis-trans isomerase [Vicinamibacterales bacterium]